MSLAEVTDGQRRRKREKSDYDACRTRCLHDGALNGHLDLHPKTQVHEQLAH